MTAGADAAASVGLLVVTWNGMDTSRRCIRSLLESEYPSSRVCLIDNGSTADIAGPLSREFPQIDTVRLPRNLGYAGGCNAGLKWAIGHNLDYAMLLNDDTTADPSMVGALVTRAEALQGNAVIAPKILVSGRPDIVWSAGGRLRRLWFKADHLEIGPNSEQAQEVEWASGCALLVPLGLLSRLGLMDERYFMYLEDVDWCLRMRHAAVPIWYEPSARLWHDVSASVGTLDECAVRYYSYRNHYLLAFKHSGLIGRAWFALHFAITSAKIGFRWAFFSSYRRNPWYHARTRAMADFLRGRFGRAPYHNDGIGASTTGMA